MKKRIVLIFSLVITLVLCLVLVFELIPRINNLKENNVKESVVENATQSTLSKEALAVAEKENTENPSQTEESLSAEDKAVKAKIANSVETNIDFRFAK